MKKLSQDFRLYKHAIKKNLIQSKIYNFSKKLWILALFIQNFCTTVFHLLLFFPQNTNTIQRRFFFLFILTFVIKLIMKETLLQINIEKQHKQVKINEQTKSVYF